MIKNLEPLQRYVVFLELWIKENLIMVHEMLLSVIFCGVLRCVVTWRGAVWCGVVWFGVAFCGVAWLGCDVTRVHSGICWFLWYYTLMVVSTIHTCTTSFHACFIKRTDIKLWWYKPIFPNDWQPKYWYFTVTYNTPPAPYPRRYGRWVCRACTN